MWSWRYTKCSMHHYALIRPWYGIEHFSFAGVNKTWPDFTWPRFDNSSWLGMPDMGRCHAICISRFSVAICDISHCTDYSRVQTTCETKAPFVKLLYVLRQFGANVGQIHSCVECSIMKFWSKYSQMDASTKLLWIFQQTIVDGEITDFEILIFSYYIIS